jgi:hypothetical protein
MGANLVYNGGAEDGTFNGWTIRDFGIDGSAGSGSTSTTATFSGTYSFRASNDGGLNQPISLVPGATYTLSARMKVFAPGPGDGAQGELVVGTTTTGREIADKDCTPNAFDATPNTDKWVLCSVTFVAQSGTDVSAVTTYVGFRAAATTHTVLVDNVTLVRGGLASGYNPITTIAGTSGVTAISGNVGIGNPSPTDKLEVFNGNLRIDSGATTEAFDSQGVALTTTSHNILFNGGSTERPEISWYRGTRTYPEFSIRENATADTGGTFWAGTGIVAPVAVMTVLNTGFVGIGTTSPTNILSLGNTAAQKFWIENTVTDVVGRALTIAAGGTVAGTSVSDVVGGNLILQSGLGTGTGASTISFQTGTTLTTGTTLQTMSTKMTILGNGNVGISCADPDHLLELGGTGAGCNTGTGSWIAAGSTAFTANSSREWKQNIQNYDIPDILEKIQATPARTFDWKPEYCTGPDCTNNLGFIAQEFFGVLSRGDNLHVNGQDIMMADGWAFSI